MEYFAQGMCSSCSRCSVPVVDVGEADWITFTSMYLCRECLEAALRMLQEGKPT